MPLHDLAQATPGLILVVLAPGFALATLLAPRWRAWERLAAAPGLSAGFIGVLGLTERLVHVAFEPLTVLPALGLLCVAAYLRHRAIRGRRPGEAGAGSAADGVDRGGPWWVPLPALLAGAVGAGMFVLALRGQVLPPDWDPTVHGGLASAIARTHDVLPLTPVPLEATSLARARPGFEATAAVVSWVGGPAPASSMVPVVVAVLALLPLGLTFLALEATGSVALAAIVPLMCLGLAFPADQAILGRFPLLIDSTLVVPLIVAARRAVQGRNPWDNAALIVAATASIWVTHGLEMITAALVGCALVITTVVGTFPRSPSVTVRGSALAAVATGAGALLVTALTRLPHTAAPLHPEPTSVVLPQSSLPVHPHEFLQLITQTSLTSPVAIALFCAGVVSVVVRRRMLWLLVPQFLVVLVMLDTLFWHHFEHAIRVVFPWADTDRLLGLEYWIIPLFIAAGVLGTFSLLQVLARDRRAIAAAAGVAVLLLVVVVAERHRLASLWNDVFGTPVAGLFPLGTFTALATLGTWWVAIAAAAAAPAMALFGLSLGGGRSAGGGRTPSWAWARISLGAAAPLAIIAVLSVWVGARADLIVYQRAVINRALVTPADVQVMATMSTTLPEGTYVLTDGSDDAGMWMTALTDLTPLVPNGFEGASLGTPLVMAVADACRDPAAAVQAVRSAGAVFVGSHHIVLGGTYAWDTACIARLPGLRLIASASDDGGEAAAFAVTR